MYQIERLSASYPKGQVRYPNKSPTFRYTLTCLFQDPFFFQFAEAVNIISDFIRYNIRYIMYRTNWFNQVYYSGSLPRRCQLSSFAVPGYDSQVRQLEERVCSRYNKAMNHRRTRTSHLALSSSWVVDKLKKICFG